MRLLFSIALKHLLARKRQSFVSLLGIVLGSAFFLAISSLMRGSERDFVRRLIDNSPHITISDEHRGASVQPLEEDAQYDVVDIRGVKPRTETRGIRGYGQILDWLRTIPGTRASAILIGQGLVNFAGKDLGVTLNGMVPSEVRDVTTIAEYMKEGTVDDLIVDPDGIIVGAELVRKMSLKRGDILSVGAATGQVRFFKIIGIFRTGRSSYDETQTFVHLKRAQALLDRGQRVNSIIVKLADPSAARRVASTVEARAGYKAVSWQESSEDLMSTLAIRNTIMFTVVSAVLVVAAFGIYNVISTVVMEKQRDIAILKSMGFFASDVRRIFVIQGVILGLVGSGLGLPLGSSFMYGLGQIRMKPPGASETIQMPLDWGLDQFAIAATFAIVASVVAALLPARKASLLQPVDILRGGS
jgi:lipoprotein-releasing system permease protein